MPIRVSKLVYLPVGGALATGLVVSALVQPQAQLAASQTCYGVCNSTTALTLSRSTLIYGHESRVNFGVRVTADAAGSDHVTGRVEVAAGTQVLCTFRLRHGEGHCSPRNRELAPGSYEIEAHYLGGRGIDPSTSNSEHLDVLKGSSNTTLSLSRNRITEGREADEDFRVRVTTGAFSRGDATGTVEVDAGTQVLCTFQLRHGKGRCSLSDGQLKPGRYRIQALYLGNAYFSASVSRRQRLIVRRA
jgi:hypothetical protein